MREPCHLWMPQAHASAAIVNFSENCDQELLPPYLDTLITKLMTLLQNGQRMVQVRQHRCQGLWGQDGPESSACW